MHSSRKRTGRSLTVCRSLLLGVGCLLRRRGVGVRGCVIRGASAPGVSAPRGVCLLPGQVCLLWGVSAPRGVCLLPGMCLLLRVCLLPGVSATERGVCSEGCLLLGQCLLLGGGGCLLQWGGIQACTEADIPPVNRMTDRYKNITLATTSLRPVITGITLVFALSI